MYAGDTGLEPLDAGAVVDGVEKTGDQVQRLVGLEAAHVLPEKTCLGAALGGAVEHRLVDVQPAAGVAGIEEMAHVRAGTAGQVEMALAAVAEQLLQAVHAVALRGVVDVRAHQVVIARQVGIESVAGHGDPSGESRGAHHIASAAVRR